MAMESGIPVSKKAKLLYSDIILLFDPKVKAPESHQPVPEREEALLAPSNRIDQVVPKDLEATTTGRILMWHLTLRRNDNARIF